MKPVAVVVAFSAFGWALVTAADARHELKPTVFETIVVEAVGEPVSDEDVDVPTPIADSLIDWEELDRQTDCLWEFMQRAGVEITLDVVLAAGTWSDAMGGACLLIGEDDE